MCDTTTGMDSCDKYSACVRTPCKVCSDCLANWTSFVKAQVFNQDLVSVKSAFTAYCTSIGYDGQRCEAAKNADLATLTGLKRAGLICNLLKDCNQTDVKPGCVLAATGSLNATDGVLDLCKMEGITAGQDPPGTSSVGLPLGTCDFDDDCASTPGSYCNKASPKSFATCTRSAGADTTRQLGLCMLTPKKACERCLDSFGPFVAAGQSAAMVSGASFVDFCKNASSPKASPAACDRVAQGIDSSFKGNLGRRAGAMCLLAGECKPVNLTGVTLSLASGQNGTFSRCTQEGVSPGAAVSGYPTVLNTTVAAGKVACRAQFNNCTAEEFCNFAGATDSCTCDEATGKEACVQLGVCQKTPCSVCQTCLTTMRDTQNITTGYTSTFTSAPRCPTIMGSADPCTAIATKYFPGEFSGATRLAAHSLVVQAVTEFDITHVSLQLVNLNLAAVCFLPFAVAAVSPIPNAFFALRAGAVCTAMQSCTGLPATCTVPLKATSIVTPAVNITGSLDLCTREGLTGGSQLPRVLTASGRQSLRQP